MKKGSNMGKYYFRARRNSKGKRGEGLVEFAMVLPLFFLLIFAIIDLAHLYWVQVTLENAIRQAGRYAVTGRSFTGLTRVESIKEVAENAAPGMLDPTQINISGEVNNSLVGGVGTASFAGYPGQNVTISLTTHLSLFTPMIG